MTSLDPPPPELIAAARLHLAKVDPALAVIHAATPTFEWRQRPGGFAGLVRMVVEQQISVAAAASVWARIEQGLGEVAPTAVLARDEDALRAFGLSRPKARYAHAIAHAHLSGVCDFATLRRLSDEEAVSALTAIKGVGLWTAEVYMMFCEGRLDAFPGGDVALREALRWADRAERRPSQTDAYRRAETWRPYRGVAAHLLWRCYGGVKRGEIPAF